jgi:dUTP pyrophosphatase
MGVLSKSEIISRLKGKRSILEGLLDEKLQLQPAGVDLTLRDVYRLKTAGSIDLTNEERKISECERIEFNGNWLKLEKGIYKITYNEIVHIPEDCIALGFPRSSLVRCGATIYCAVWDPGYEGRSESLLVVENEHGIKLKRNARLVQLVFLKLNKKAREAYSGAYKKENI